MRTTGLRLRPVLRSKTRSKTKMSAATVARTASSWRSRWRRRSRRTASPGLLAAVWENATFPNSTPMPPPGPTKVVRICGPSGGRVAQEPAGGPGGRGGVDAVVTVEIPSSARLAEIVDAERRLRHAEGRAEEGQGMGVAVEDRHEGYVFLVGAHEAKEMRVGVSQATVQAIGAGDRKDAGQDAVLAKLLRRGNGIGHHDARRKDVHHVFIGRPIRLRACIHESVAPLKHVGAVLGTGRGRQALIEWPGREPQIQALAFAAGDLTKTLEEDPLDLASKHRLVIRDAG